MTGHIDRIRNNLMKNKIYIDFLLNMVYNAPIMTTEELLQKCVNEDRIAWDRFVRHYSALVSRTVKYKLNKLSLPFAKSEVFDIAQEIFLLIWEKNKLSEVKDTACLKSWLVMVSLNATSNYCKKKAFKTLRNTVSLNKNPDSETPEIILESMIPSPKLNTAKMVESNELGAILKKEISKLVTKQQLALKLSIYDGKSQKDISEIMNIPGGTAAILVKRAKKQLRKELRKILRRETGTA